MAAVISGPKGTRRVSQPIWTSASANCSAQDTNFRNANLTGVDFTNAVLGGAILRRADVTDADFQGVELASVTMEFANFSKAKHAVIPSYKRNLR